LIVLGSQARANGRTHFTTVAVGTVTPGAGTFKGRAADVILPDKNTGSEEKAGEQRYRFQHLLA
jgi:hypothetical protein